jgi:glutathione synthase/RimK-type ligase-like ATP-grasp enzyme
VQWTAPERVIVARRRNVDPQVWAASSLTVERFINNPAGRFHRAYLLGDRVAVATSHASNPFKDMVHNQDTALATTEAAHLRASSLQDPIHVAQRIATAMEIDYAAIDLMEDEAGVIYPVDVNTTPYWGDLSNPALIDHLKAGWRQLADAV